MLRDGNGSEGSEGGKGGRGKAGGKGGAVSEVPEKEREQAASSLLFAELGLSRNLVRGEVVGGGNLPLGMQYTAV